MTLDTKATGIKERLTAVVLCLMEYKAKIINKMTINITTPADLLNDTMPLLSKRCELIKEFMLRHERPLSEDNDFNDCLDCLEKALTPWDMDMSILCPEFCERIFEGFNQNPDKIEIIKDIDFYCPIVDGVPDDEPQGSQN